MSRAIEQTVERLSEQLADACKDALIAAGFHPSERLMEKITDDIRYSLGLSS